MRTHTFRKPNCSTCNDVGMVLKKVSDDLSDFTFRCDCEVGNTISKIVRPLADYFYVCKLYEKPIMRDNQPTEAEA